MREMVHSAPADLSMAHQVTSAFSQRTVHVSLVCCVGHGTAACTCRQELEYACGWPFICATRPFVSVRL